MGFVSRLEPPASSDTFPKGNSVLPGEDKQACSILITIITIIETIMKY